MCLIIKIKITTYTKAAEMSEILINTLLRVLVFIISIKDLNPSQMLNLMFVIWTICLTIIVIMSLKVVSEK